MKKKYFNIYLEFDKEEINRIISDAIISGAPAYVCAVDSNSLVNANENSEHLEALNNSLTNLSDSAWIPLLINRIYHTNYHNYTGADLFIKWVQSCNLRHFFLGSKPDILEGLKDNLLKINSSITDMQFEALPFKDVENFDYLQIAKMINEDKPDIIWVSLGAPKQEQFMNRLNPYLNKGVMIGIGAVFKFYSDKSAINRSPRWIINLKLEWLYRISQEPRRMFRRYGHIFLSLPKLIINEIKIRNSLK
ncbi:MAG: WecB/TagA/CpsF family glycosyltransferase [Dysgonamonadaceae bacterium]|jgi:N-acetylglucosaminyldiphosphoundecaprenol N-acetyl-beta-D-mannosaminyltransferase|nr:WecB/TagA/CpsF family glycosyltransferase [Dysgonamonadaceae bacterium]